MAKKFAVLLVAAIFLIFFTSGTNADELLDVQNQINKKNSELSRTQASLENIKKSIANIGNSLTGSQADLEKANAQAEVVKKDLEKAETDLATRRESLDYLIEVRNKQIRSIYQFPQRTALEMFLSEGDIDGFTQNLSYQSSVLGDSRKLIKAVNQDVLAMESTRNEIIKSKNELDTLIASLNTKIADLKSSYTASVAQQANLNNQSVRIKSSLAGLSTKQNQLIAAKIGNSIATGSLALADDANARVTFNPGFSPAFAAFSFGAFTHRNGMSQYGARARANAGQSAEQILGAYYPGSSLNQNYPIPATVYVNGTNEYGQNFNCQAFSMSDYVKRLYEVPSSWPTAVLRAQAVAARSYAVKYLSTTVNRCGNPPVPYICPSQNCQVVKQEINATSWQDAVDYTATWVLTGGSGFQYSSTSGGYLNTSGWDTTCGNMSCWPGQAWESLAPSPWFYKGWYKTLGGATCGRSHPWLTEPQFVDILNSWVVYQNGNSTDKARVVTTDTGCWGGNPYSTAEMKSRADQLGGSYSSVQGATASYSNGGFTSSVSFYTDRGPITFDGQKFRDIFNLRAPGHLVIRTPLYNIERK